MTANHEHTPLDDLVSRMHIHFGAANAMGDDFAADDFADVIRILENMPAKLAAAEQRGAARALRDAANVMQEDLAWASTHRGLLVYENESDSGITPFQWIKNRADRITDQEGDDETH